MLSVWVCRSRLGYETYVAFDGHPARVIKAVGPTPGGTADEHILIGRTTSLTVFERAAFSDAVTVIPAQGECSVTFAYGRDQERKAADLGSASSSAALIDYVEVAPWSGHEVAVTVRN